MKPRKTCLLVASLLLLRCVLLVAAHSPLVPGENENISSSTPIPDPAKSWAIYDTLHQAGEAHYYRFSINQGGRIYVSLFVSPLSRDKGFVPNLILMGPGLPSRGSIPVFVEVPKSVGVLIPESKTAGQATYEPFSPSSFYSVSSLDITAPASGAYYIAVFEPNQGGQYGLAVGYVESFTPLEWILVPVNLISIYNWEGQSLFQILAPMIAVLVVGTYLCYSRLWKKRLVHSFHVCIGLGAGLLFLGTSAITLSQMVTALTRVPASSEVLLTLVFAAFPVILGAAYLRVLTKNGGELTPMGRLQIILVGFLAIFLWAGYLVGPIAAIVAGTIPQKGTKLG